MACFELDERTGRYPKTGLALILLSELVFVDWYAVVTGGLDWGSWQNVCQILLLAAACVVVMGAAGRCSLACDRYGLDGFPGRLPSVLPRFARFRPLSQSRSSANC